MCGVLGIGKKPGFLQRQAGQWNAQLIEGRLDVIGHVNAAAYRVEDVVDEIQPVCALYLEFAALERWQLSRVLLQKFPQCL